MSIIEPQATDGVSFHEIAAHLHVGTAKTVSCHVSLFIFRSQHQRISAGCSCSSNGIMLLGPIFSSCNNFAGLALE